MRQADRRIDLKTHAKEYADWCVLRQTYTGRYITALLWLNVNYPGLLCSPAYARDVSDAAGRKLERRNNQLNAA